MDPEPLSQVPDPDLVFLVKPRMEIWDFSAKSKNIIQLFVKFSVLLLYNVSASTSSNSFQRLSKD
jgi:hypothetical protein